MIDLFDGEDIEGILWTNITNWLFFFWFCRIMGFIKSECHC